MIIDIVTPTFNRDTFIEKTLQSVLTQQTKSQIHYYIIDGGSTDNTIKIVEENIKNNTNNKIKINLSLGEDTGMYDAIYKGFSKGNGNIMAWINSDDIYLPGALHSVETIFERFTDIDWIIGIPSYINEFDAITGINFGFPLKSRKGIKRGIYNFKNSRRLCPSIQQDAIFWRRNLWDKLHDDFFKKFRNCKYAGDFLLWQEFAKYAGLYYVHSAFSSFRIHRNQLTNNLSKYSDEMNDEKPSIKDSLISLMLNTPILAPSSLNSNLIRFIYNRLSRSHHCGMIRWNAKESCWMLMQAKNYD